MILYETKYMALKAAKREGKPDWVYAVRPNAKDVAVILPVIKKEDEDEILFLITKRPPLIEEGVCEFCVEIPAGLVGDENRNETVEDALKKELLEETGLIADEFIIQNTKVSTSGGHTSETSTIAIAIITDNKLKKAPVDDGGVIIERVYVKKSEIKTFLKEKENKGFAISAQTLAALYYL
ncbi:MAG: NUDIX hydrolase [bacterium]|nr:NUDIX hydrolase [bacterium]